jgi:hypothetical protein
MSANRFDPGDCEMTSCSIWEKRRAPPKRKSKSRFGLRNKGQVKWQLIWTIKFS